MGDTAVSSALHKLYGSGKCERSECEIWVQALQQSTEFMNGSEPCCAWLEAERSSASCPSVSLGKRQALDSGTIRVDPGQSASPCDLLTPTPCTERISRSRGR